MSKKQEFVKPPKMLVIGNGPSALELAGNIVDGYDEVVRFNQYRLRGFQDTLGTKTTTWVKNERLPDSALPRGATVIRVVPPDDLMKYRSRRITAIKNVVEGMRCPSTGICFLNHIIGQGIVPYIVGFDAYNRHKPRNYYESEWAESEPHIQAEEEAALIEWANTGMILEAT